MTAFGGRDEDSAAGYMLQSSSRLWSCLRAGFFVGLFVQVSLALVEALAGHGLRIALSVVHADGTALAAQLTQVPVVD